MERFGMLPVSDYTPKEARELTTGDFAYIEEEQSFAYVGSIPGEDPIVVLFADWGKENLAYSEALDGIAVALSDVEFEADIQSATHCETHRPKIGTLVSRGDTLSVIGMNRRGQGVFVTVRSGENTQGPAVAFARWRIVKKNGDEKVTLYENNG